MTSIARGQENTTDRINGFIYVSCQLTDAYSMEFQIWDMTAGEPGTQVFPATPGDWEDITVAPGKFGTGSYYAYDNGNSQGWTPSLTANLGPWRVKWRWRITGAANYQQAQEDITVTAESVWSTTENIITVDEVKQNYLFGLDTTNDQAQEMPDELYQYYIDAAVDWLEHRLDISLRTLTIVEERHDYYREDYGEYMWLETDHYPVIQVNSVKLVLPSAPDSVQEFDIDWVQVDRESGQVQITPGISPAGTLLIGSGNWFPHFRWANRRIPGAFRVAYKAGFGPPDPNAAGVPNPRLDSLPFVLKEIVGKLSSFGPLNIMGDLLGGAGIASQSIGIDGLSQSFNTTSSATNAGYGARLVQYNKEIKEQIPTLTRYYKGLRLRVA